MADELTKEQKFSCGCHIVDGKLVAECTQVAPSGEISAERHSVLKPFAAKCARKAALDVAESFTTQPEMVVPIPDGTSSGSSGTVTVVDVDTTKHEVTLKSE